MFSVVAAIMFDIMTFKAGTVIKYLQWNLTIVTFLQISPVAERRELGGFTTLSLVISVFNYTLVTSALFCNLIVLNYKY